MGMGEFIAPISVAGALGAAAALWCATRRRGSARPDYAAADAWYVREDAGAGRGDVFYAHPTTGLGVWAQNIAWEGRRVCTGGIGGDADLCRGQAGAWREKCDLWAPKYREMGFLAQLVNLEAADDAQLAKTKAALDLALGDLKAAFEYFLAHRKDPAKPFFVAAHSQGAFHVLKVLADCIEGTPHAECFVAAYLCGGFVPTDLFEGAHARFKTLHPCRSPTDLQCVISYDTRLASFAPEQMQNVGFGLGLWPDHLHWLLHDKYCPRPYGADDVSKPRIQINPGTWSAAPGGAHLGVQASYAGKRADTVDGVSPPLAPPAGYAGTVRVTDKAVVVADPSAWIPAPKKAVRHGNLHPVDVHFWFYNIRRNVAERLRAWEAAREGTAEP
eukprot:TRINITY_DN585_c1_g1_i15.p1 TRINITY_DN585_c1_g1~~TRINITY_DN585_c1_g1_i15.p1  ORF type:complete len:406 (+),score=92.05 TRINITY_DN585_c1_g1_i15:59-1219(+)